MARSESRKAMTPIPPERAARARIDDVLVLADAEKKDVRGLLAVL